MKLLLFYFLMLFVWCFQAKQAILSTSVTQAPKDQQNVEENNAFLMKGWLKFFTYTPTFTASSLPTKFEFNQVYANQFTYGRAPTFADKDKDNFGWFNIIDDTHFFFILTKTSLYAVYARRNDIAKTYKSIDLKWIEPVITGDAKGPRGGVEDIGNYKEGFCFKLKLNTNVIWNLCADTMDDKSKWMSAFLQLLQMDPIKANGAGESVLISKEVSLPFTISAGSSPLPEVGSPAPSIQPGSRIDGRWVVLQDWSQCTQACGGGKQYLQRMCVPPQNGGLPCDGDTLLVKSCNEQQCPNVITTEKEGPANPTVMKMQQISSRPLRYEICVIREIDLDLVIDAQDFAISPKYPVRVVLNNKTLSVFSTPSFDNVYKSFDLNYLQISISQQEPRICNTYSDIRDSLKKLTLCIMPTATPAGSSIEDYRERWIRDILFFKNKCKDKNKYVEESPEIKKRMKDIEIEARNEKYERIKEKENEDDQKRIEMKAQNKAEVALQAVAKETKIEQLSMEEELMREAEEENSLNKQIEDEIEKQRCMERETLKKNKIIQQQKEKLVMDESSDVIKKQVAFQIENSRKEFQKRINQLRRSNERRRRESRSKFSEIRTEMVDIARSNNHIGDITKCNPNVPNPRKSYCNKKYLSNGLKALDCIGEPGSNEIDEDFCYFCCESEFGISQNELRQKCYGLCDKFDKGIDKTGEGNWNITISDT